MPALAAGLLARSQNNTTHCALAQEQTARLVRALQPAPWVRFAGTTADGVDVAHAAGVNSLEVDKFEGKYLISGGADGSMSIWDLESGEENAYSAAPTDDEVPEGIRHVPLQTCNKSQQNHSYGITSLQFYPFDSLAFVSSSYDHTVKIWSSTTLSPSASFPLGSVVYDTAMSPIASHLLVACATQHPAVRLIDLRSAASTHSLAGHTGGAVLCVDWSPKHEHIVASGAADGTIRVWDVRRSAGCLGTMDLEDSKGLVTNQSIGHHSRPRESGRAHLAPVNGLVWTRDGQHLISTGNDEKIRVWDMHSGANTLVNFGPKVKNRNFSKLLPLIAPEGLMPQSEDVLFFPSEKDILMFELFEGRIMKTLKDHSRPQSRIATLVWRNHCIEMFSAHANGSIRSWRPHTPEDFMVEEELRAERRPEKRKFGILDDVERHISSRNITFT